MNRPAALLLGGFLLVRASFGQDYADIPTDVDFPASPSRLEAMRATGNLDAQRNHMWQVFSGITRQQGQSTLPAFLTWFGAGEVFAPPSETSVHALRGLQQAFLLPDTRGATHPSLGSVPLIVRAHYSAAAYTHIRQGDLESRGALSGAANAVSIPAFPRNSVVVKSVWWPIPEEGVVALPVWYAADNAPRAAGNDYLTWSRVVGVSARPDLAAGGGTVDVEFLGRSFKRVRAIGVDSLYHVTLDQRTADQLMLDAESRKVAGLVLGRPLRANDMVALVALHLATRELAEWIWATFWWHDEPRAGPYAPPRQPMVGGPWQNYLMSVSFDADRPREPDGSPHVAFNPWLEARFPDGGQGSGVVSNCATCHRRASTAVERPFMVTRGGEDLRGRAPVKGAVTTSSLWSIPLQAR